MLINRLNAYILPGRAAHPAPGLEQAQAGEAMGLGGIFMSERWEPKELCAMLVALTQVTSLVKLVAGLTHFGMSHPLRSEERRLGTVGVMTGRSRWSPIH